MMMTVKENCNMANFHVKAVLRYIYPTYAVYDVVCNCGSSRFIPMNGDKLPKMVLDFMADHEADAVKYSPECMVFYAEVPV